MNQKLDLKISIWVVPITWVVAAITTIILWAVDLDWMCYLIGVCTGLLNFGLMIKMNRRIMRMAELYPENAKSMAKRQSWIGVIIRILVFMGVFLALFFKMAYQNPDGILSLVTAFGGFATVKVVLIIIYFIFRRRLSE